jgi:peptidylprolyl isomerase
MRVAIALVAAAAVFAAVFYITAASQPQVQADVKVVAAPEQKEKPEPKEEPKGDKKVVTTATGLKYIDEKEGTGRAAKVGDTVVVHYTGTFKDGKKFDSSRDRDRPFPVRLGAGEVIRGWEEGLIGMKAGAKRKLIIPSALAYGPAGRPPVIPPNAELHFDIEVMEIR